MNDRFHYDALVDDALRSVVRRVLTQVAETGLPGSHHFYISFRSTDPGVEIPDYLRAKYPEEMTNRAPAPVLGPHHRRHELRGDGELQQAAGAHQGPVRRALRPSSIRRCALACSSTAATRPRATRFPATGRPATGRKGLRSRHSCRCRRSRPPVPAPEGQDTTAEGEAATDEAAKPEDAASKVVKLDSFRKK